VVRSHLFNLVYLFNTDLSEWRTRGHYFPPSWPQTGRSSVSDVVYSSYGCTELNGQLSHFDGLVAASCLLQPLAVQQARHQVSFYADDAVIFLRPYNLDLITIRHLLDLFGHASGLRTNLAKSSVSPNHCNDEDLALTTNILSCAIKTFPCTYLGLPLSIGKPTKEVLLL